MSTFGQPAPQPAPDQSEAGNDAFSPAALTPTLPLQIAERIGAAIVEERFAPGERLKEVDLARAFGVSRTSVREALRLLGSRALVTILPQRGALVTLLARDELENLFEIRAVLLGLAARDAARRYTPADDAALAAGIASLARGRDDVGAYVRASAAMVAGLARLSRNAELAQMIAGFAQRIGRYTRLGLASRERRARSLASWRRLVQAISTKDERRAEEITRGLALENRDAALLAIETRAPQKAARGGETKGRQRRRKSPAG
ncbi:MAG TPA: GntR family transcriptional regulator [Casimicrobiaceae bacterium]|nr:GntR family transcriptional regulator [Casimicrobiaceae bacterium]